MIHRSRSTVVLSKAFLLLLWQLLARDPQIDNIRRIVIKGRTAASLQTWSWWALRREICNRAAPTILLVQSASADLISELIPYLFRMYCQIISWIGISHSYRPIGLHATTQIPRKKHIFSENCFKKLVHTGTSKRWELHIEISSAHLFIELA